MKVKKTVLLLFLLCLCGCIEESTDNTYVIDYGNQSAHNTSVHQSSKSSTFTGYIVNHDYWLSDSFKGELTVLYTKEENGELRYTTKIFKTSDIETYSYYLQGIGKEVYVHTRYDENGDSYYELGTFVEKTSSEDATK